MLDQMVRMLDGWVIRQIVRQLGCVTVKQIYGWSARQLACQMVKQLYSWIVRLIQLDNWIVRYSVRSLDSWVVRQLDCQILKLLDSQMGCCIGKKIVGLLVVLPDD